MNGDRLARQTSSIREHATFGDATLEWESDALTRAIECVGAREVAPERYAYPTNRLRRVIRDSHRERYATASVGALRKLGNALLADGDFSYELSGTLMDESVLLPSGWTPELHYVSRHAEGVEYWWKTLAAANEHRVGANIYTVDLETGLEVSA